MGKTDLAKEGKYSKANLSRLSLDFENVLLREAKRAMGTRMGGLMHERITCWDL